MFGRKETLSSFLADVDTILEDDNDHLRSDPDITTSTIASMRALLAEVPVNQLELIFKRLQKEGAK